MNVEELSQLTVAELRARANTSLDGVEAMSAMERQHHLVEAQFYVDEIERRAQKQERLDTARTATRDLILEIVVIVLIGIEIYIGWIAIQAGSVESEKQMVVLGELRKSVDTLNVSTGKTADNIAKLTKAQNDALDTQKRSLNTVSAMNSAMQKQLNILRESQTQAQQQQILLTEQLDNMRSQTAVLQKQWEKENQKPLLVMLLGTNVLQPDSYLFLEFARPKARVPLTVILRNAGTAPIRRPQLRADAEAPTRLDCVYYPGFMVSIESPCQVEHPELPDISAGAQQVLYVSFTVPSSSNEFTVHFTISAENLSASVYSLHITLK